MNKMTVGGEGGVPNLSQYTSPSQTIAVAETSYDFYGDYFAPDEYGYPPSGTVTLQSPQKPGNINDTDFDASFPAWNGSDSAVTLESGITHRAHAPFDINPHAHGTGTNYLYADG
jgi:prepilin-type processing-associated H-X9-DG protein